jgi:hypothetical protein
MSQYDPWSEGPWIPVAVGNAYRVMAQDANGVARVIAQVGDPEAECPDTTRERWRADAELIARAPDLVVALEQIAEYVPAEVDSCRGSGCRNPWCADCQGEETAAAALAEAHTATREALRLLSILRINACLSRF